MTRKVTSLPYGGTMKIGKFLISERTRPNSTGYFSVLNSKDKLLSQVIIPQWEDCRCCTKLYKMVGKYLYDTFTILDFKYHDSLEEAVEYAFFLVKDEKDNLKQLISILGEI